MADTFVGLLDARIAEEQGTPLYSIADRLRVHPTVLASWRKGRCLPGPRSRELLSVFLRVTPALIGDLIAAEKRRRDRAQPVSAAEGFA